MTDNANIGSGSHRIHWRIWVWSVAALMLLVPLLAMQFTDQVNWDGSDFAILVALLLGVGVTIEMAIRKTDNTGYRAAVGIALAAAFLLIVMNVAVGIIGTENNDANLMFGGVLAVGLIGSAIARFRPAGMARTLFATAIAQVLVAVIAVFAGFGSADPSWPLDILMLTGVFAALWLTSARLFRKSAREPK